jgi:hypothetical protein
VGSRTRRVKYTDRRESGATGHGAPAARCRREALQREQVAQPQQLASATPHALGCRGEHAAHSRRATRDSSTKSGGIMSSSSSSSSSPSSSPSPSPKPISWASGGGGWGGYGYGYVVCGRGWGPGYRRLVSLACVVECCQARRQCRHCAVCHQHRLVHVNVSAERRVLVHPQPAASAQLLLDGLACGRLARQLSWELLVWHAHAATVLYLVLHAVKLRSEVGSAARHAATAATPDS